VLQGPVAQLEKRPGPNRTQPEATGPPVAVAYGHGRLPVAVASILVKLRTGKKPVATS
jgi:hypothetical protein